MRSISSDYFAQKNAVGGEKILPDPTVLTGSNPLPRMSERLANSPKNAIAVAEPLSYTMSTLPSGVKVVTENRIVPVAAVGISSPGGPRYETEPWMKGAFYFLERMCFKETKFNTSQDIVRQVERGGGNAFASVTQEEMFWACDCLQEDIDNAVRMLSNNLFYSVYNNNEIDYSRQIIPFEFENYTQNTVQYVVDALCHTAFRGSPLGDTLFPSQENLSRVNSDTLKAVAASTFQPDRLTIAGIGIEHAVLVESVNRHIPIPSDITTTTDTSSTDQKAKASVPSLYIGGYAHLPDIRHVNPLAVDEGQMIDVGLAWKAPSLHETHDMTTLMVLSTLLGGGDSFSSGGPGKGMFSILYEKVLVRHHFMKSAKAIVQSFSDNGLFCLYGKAPAHMYEHLLSALLTPVRELLKPGGIEESRLRRAKNMLMYQYLSQLETRQGAVDNMARQAMHLGKIASHASVQADIESVTAKDIYELLRKMFASPATLVTLAKNETLHKDDIIERVEQFMRSSD